MRHLSIPIKIVLMTVFFVVPVWLGSVYLVNFLGISWRDPVLGIPFKFFFWALQILTISLVFNFASYYFLDRPLRKLAKVMLAAEKGDFLVRSSLKHKDQLGQFGDSLNRMIAKVTDLSAHKIQTEQDLLIAQEELNLKKRLDEKKTLLEKTNQKLEHLVRDFSLLYDIGQQINQTVHIEELYSLVANAMRKELNLSNFSLMRWNRTRNCLEFKAMFGLEISKSMTEITFSPGEGIAGQVLNTGKEMYVPNCSRDHRFVAIEGLRMEGSLLVMPLQYKGDTLGVINFGRAGEDSFSAQEIQMLKLVSNQVALTMANAELYTKTQELSVTDELTQVYNRRHFQQVLQLEWKRASRFRRNLSVLMADVDFFKKVNDQFGHLIGDEILRQMGGLLKSCLREVDTVARFGGEEFVVLLPDTDKQGALAVAEKIRHLISTHSFGPETLGSQTPGLQTLGSITVSVGISCYPDDANEMDELIDHADIALYEAKDRGRNLIAMYKSEKDLVDSPATVH